MKIVLSRRQRSAWGWEWHSHNGVRFVNVWIGDRHVHRWWAFSLYLYLTGG